MKRHQAQKVVRTTSPTLVEVGKTKEDRHACKFCLKFFVRKETLERHIKIIHMKTETCSCSICGKIFASKDGLKVHLKVHDEKNDVINRCPECQKVYTNSSDLDKHCKITGHQYQIKDNIKLLYFCVFMHTSTQTFTALKY